MGFVGLVSVRRDWEVEGRDRCSALTVVTNGTKTTIIAVGAGQFEHLVPPGEPGAKVEADHHSSGHDTSYQLLVPRPRPIQRVACIEVGR